MASPESPDGNLPHRYSTEPLYVDAGRIIENVYERRGIPDTDSQDDFEQYLVERMYGPTSTVADQFEPGKYKEVKSWERGGWLLRPRTALIATLAATLALNAVINTAPLTQRAVDAIGHGLDDLGDQFTSQPPAPNLPAAPQTTTQTRPGPLVFNVSVPGREQPSGVALPGTITAEKLVKKVEQTEKHGYKITDIDIRGSASDEWLAKGERSLGVPDTQNRLLSEDRAETVKTAVQKLLRRDGVKTVAVNTQSSEKVLDADQLGSLLEAVNELGYGSITSAVIDYNQGKAMQPGLRNLIKDLIGSKRSVIATLNFSRQPAPVVTTHNVARHRSEPPKHKHKGKHHKLLFGFIPFPIIPIPRLRRRSKALLDTTPIVPREVPEEIELELYQEALGKDNKLADDSWSWSRKYQALLREERIEKMLRFDYKDADGEDQSFRVGFADHQPTPETVEVISELMQKISLLRGGKVAKKLDMIMVFPTENTGPQHPKQIGLGIDRQFDTNVLGLAIPALNLVELHMNPKPTEEELRGFDSMSWTLAHEVAGHFTDVKKAAVSLRRVAGPPNRKNYVASDPWLQSASDDYAMVGRQDKVSLSGLQFAIPRPPGNPEEPSVLTDEFLVGHYDHRLPEARFVRLQRLDPTGYAGQNALELHAEVAAQVVTEALIPFEAVGVDLPESRSGGYRVDAGLLWRFARHVGSLQNRDGLAWPTKALKRIEDSWIRRGLVVNQDLRVNEQSERAKKAPYQPDEDRLRIVTRATE